MTSDCPGHRACRSRRNFSSPSRSMFQPVAVCGPSAAWSSTDERPGGDLGGASMRYCGWWPRDAAGRCSADAPSGTPGSGHAEAGPTARKPPRRVLLRRLPAGASGPGLSDDPANVVVPLGRGVPHVRATVAGDVDGVIDMAQILPVRVRGLEQHARTVGQAGAPSEVNSRACPASGQDSRRARRCRTSRVGGTLVGSPRCRTGSPSHGTRISPQIRPPVRRVIGPCARWPARRPAR